MRRYLIIGAIVIVFIGILVAAYFLFFANGSTLSVTPPTGATLPEAGNVLPTAPTGGSSPIGNQQPSATQVSTSLVQIDKGPVVAGAIAFDLYATSTATTTNARGRAVLTTIATLTDEQINYLERASGNVFSYAVGTKAITRISNRTIPGIEEARWLPTGATAFIRYISGTNASTINTYALPSSGTGGFFLPQNITDLSVSSSSVLMIASGVNGSIASTEKPDGSGSKQVFTTPLSMIHAQDLGGGKYLVYTKPSAEIPGDAYLVAGGNFSRIAGPLAGLSALGSPHGNYVLVTYSSAGVMKSELVNIKTQTTTQLPLGTIADKCVWTSDEKSIYCGVPQSPSAAYAYPDDWYQGAVSFSDRIWKIDVQGRYAQLALDLTKASSGAIDITSPAIDSLTKVMVFKNKSDASLWLYQL